MTARRKVFDPETRALIRLDYEMKDASVSSLARTWGLARNTVLTWAKEDNWQRNRMADKPSTALTPVVLEYLKENPNATATELAIVAHDDISERRAACETELDNTARHLHGLLQQSITNRDGMTIAVMAAGAKALESIGKIRRQSLGMKDDVCYRLLNRRE
ncbi:hypothetical protein NUL63_004560 [Salmonella enterica]|nr:hypothetical protein [Salmonella enterica]